MKPFFNRAAIKQAAKSNLKNHYWLSLAVALLSGMFTGGGISFGVRFMNIDTTQSNVHGLPENSGLMAYLISVFGSRREVYLFFVSIFAGVFVVLLTVSLLKYYFVGGPLVVGGSRYFINLTKGQARFTNLAYGFANKAPDGYKHVRQSMFRAMLYIFLWSLLGMVPFALLAVVGAVGLSFVEAHVIIALCVLAACLLMPVAMIPAIVKSYEYSMIPYLLAEHPEMDRQTVFAASKALTAGHKGDLFVLDLSFLGWYLLGVLCCGIGTIFVVPYHTASRAQAYAVLCTLAQTEDE